MELIIQIKNIIEDYNLIEKSKKIIKQELLSLPKQEVEELLKGVYTQRELVTMSEKAILKTYGIDFLVMQKVERIKLSFDLIDDEESQLNIYYCYFDREGNYIDSFFD